MAESPRIVELQQKFEDNPPRYFASLANEYRKAGDFQRAIAICGIYLDKLPEHIAGHAVLAQALHSMGRLDEAAETYKAVLNLDPENLLALKGMGDIAHASGDLLLAHDNFRKVLTADPRDHDTNRRLKTVEQAMKVAAEETAQDWIPPRVSDEFALPNRGDIAEAAVDETPQQSLEVENLPTLEPPASHEDIPEDDFVDTLMPDSVSEHHPTIAEPVALESSEDSLAVPDLMEEAGEVALSGDEFQYRTAEFSLPNVVASEAESASQAAEMETEAEALMEEAEIPPAPEPDPTAHRFDRPMRTGEYSLSHDTAEWNRESGEPAHSLDDEPLHDITDVEPAGPFITETVAELYLQQGFTGEALLVYRQLARAKPNDQRIADRIASLEQRLADEHTVRQAALDTPPVSEIEQAIDSSSEPVSADVQPIPESAFVNERHADLEEFDRAWAPDPPPPPPPPPPQAVPQDQDDWFSAPDIPAARTRQTVQEFFAVLGRAKAEIRRKPERVRVTAAEIRAAADITAGFGAFGMEPQHSVPKPIPEARPGDENPQDDVRRFRAWLDGLSDS